MSRVGRFVVLTYILSLPFLILGGTTGAFLLPGLPIAAVMAICPGVAALILRWRDDGAAGMRALLHRALDWRRVTSAVWWLPVLLTFPAITMASYVWQRWSGVSVPDPQIGVAQTAALAAVFLLSGLAEELGWTAQSTEPLLERHGMVRVALIIGALWAGFHVVALRQAHRSFEWIAWWTLYTVSVRVIMVWIFARGGRSIFAVSVFHMSLNVCWQLYPVHGSHYDIRRIAILSAIVALAVAMPGRNRGPALQDDARQ